MSRAHVRFALGFTSRGRLGNFGIAVVLRSENTEISVGDHLYGWLSEFDGFLAVHTNIMMTSQISRIISSVTIRRASRKFPIKRNCRGRCISAPLAWLVRQFCHSILPLKERCFCASGKTASFGWKEYSAAQKVCTNSEDSLDVIMLKYDSG